MVPFARWKTSHWINTLGKSLLSRQLWLLYENRFRGRPCVRLRALLLILPNEELCTFYYDESFGWDESFVPVRILICLPKKDKNLTQTKKFCREFTLMKKNLRQISCKVSFIFLMRVQTLATNHSKKTEITKL